MSSFSCTLCPGGIPPSNPYAELYISDLLSMTCGEMDVIAAEFSNEDPAICNLIQTQYGPTCGCDTKCSPFSFTSCSRCVGAGGCSWCPESATCVSDEYVGQLLTSSSSSSSSCATLDDWIGGGGTGGSTCATTQSGGGVGGGGGGGGGESLTFNDPLYGTARWAYDLMNLEDVWSQGITGAGVRIRVNDNGVDATHPEFAGRFDFEGSCGVYSPAEGSESDHGTSSASIAAAAGNNGVCAVGVAPGATISSCRVVVGSDGVSADEENFLTVALDRQDISTNSYGALGCRPSEERRRRRLERGLQQVPCPFDSTRSGSPCSVCDFAQDVLSSFCDEAIFQYCLSPINYESDAGCVEYLESYATCSFNDVPDSSLQNGLVRGVTEGRDGKGIIFMWAAGNENYFGSDANFDWQTNTRFTISVGGVDQSGDHASYSNPGAALFVTAPGGDLDYSTNWITAAAGGGCHDATAGTSWSCPAAAGVVALMLEVNSNLGWRDVQGVLALTSQKVDPSDPTWITNGAGLSHSVKYGFGLIDASAAVSASRSWSNFGSEQVLSEQSGEINLSISPLASVSTTSSLRFDQAVVVESVVVVLELVHTSRGHLEITLTSPSGTKSVLSPGRRPENKQLPSSVPWKLMTVASWGEASAGEWTLSLTDIEEGDVSSCVDLPKLFEIINGTSLSCDELSRLEDILEEIDIEDDILPSDFSPCDDAEVAGVCCFCGGGQAATLLDNRLTSWRLLVYGHDGSTGGNSLPPSVPTTPAVPAPTTAPVAPPTESATCPDETSAAAACLNAGGNGVTCLECVFSYWPEPLTSCSDIDDETCTALDNCRCGSCGDEIIAWSECVSGGCSISCSGSSNGSGNDGGTVPTPTPAPDTSTSTEVELQCWDVKDEYDDCLARNITQVQAADCMACIDNTMDKMLTNTNGQESISCGFIADEICSALSPPNCGSSCGVCAVSIAEYYNCFVDSDPTFPSGCEVRCDQNLQTGYDDGDGLSPSSASSATTVMRIWWPRSSLLLFFAATPFATIPFLC